MRGYSREIKGLLAKARESALLAVETYNRPTATFRSGAYIVLMCIAWTSLFHAIFRKRKVAPYYRKPGSSRFQKIDGDNRAWELTECLKQFYRDQNPSSRANVELFVRLRNKFEHRSFPQLDSEIFGECQAFLMNFEELLCAEFGERVALKTGLVFALQFSKSLSPAQSTAITHNSHRQFQKVKEFVDNYRSSLSQEVQSDMKYSFKVFLVPKIGNHASSETHAVEFVKYDPSKPEEMKRYEHLVAMIKPKEVSITNLNLLKAGDVVHQVANKLGKKFNHHYHRLCYLKFNARLAGKNPSPGSWDSRYCHYDALHKDYAYEPSWVAFLVSKLSDAATYDDLAPSKK